MNTKFISTYLAGVVMIGAHSIMPTLVVPGMIALCGSMMLSAVELVSDKFMWNTLGIVNKNGVYPQKLGTRLIGKNIAYVYTIPPGLDFEDIRKKKEKIENVLYSPISLTQENFTFIITKIKNRYPKVLKRDFRECKKGCVFDLGEDMEGNVIKLDLSGTEMHTGVFGATGTGKSVGLNTIMTQIILNDYEVRVIDLKGGVEFRMYQDYPKLSKFAIKVDEAEEVLYSTLQLMNKRYEKLFNTKCKSFKDYKGIDMGPVFLVIDEYNALIDNKDCKKMLFELLSRARAANIIVIVSTQRPSADVLPGNIRCNLKNTICYQVETNTDSEVVTGQKGNYLAHKDLKGPGEAFIKTGSKFKLFKSYYLTDDEIMAQIKDKLTGQNKRIENVNKPSKQLLNRKDDIEAIKSLI